MQDIYRTQEKLRQRIHQTFAPLPIWKPLIVHRILGITQLGKLAETIFSDEDPTQVFYRGLIQEIIQQSDRYILRLPLPHVEMDKVLMTKKGDEVTIEIGNFKRDITLPTVLVNQEATVAKFVNKALRFTLVRHYSKQIGDLNVKVLLSVKHPREIDNCKVNRWL